MPAGIEDADVNELFDGAAQLYIGVVSGGGPHVTPELLATDGGRLWCLSAAVTRKVAVLQEDDRVGFYASTAKGDVVGIGHASIVDPASPRSLAAPTDVARSAIGAARFVARNAAELTGAVLDTLVGRLGRPLPPHRVVVSIEPTALAAVRDGEVVSWGDWGSSAAADLVAGEATGELDDELAPEELRELLDDGPAALGWLRTDGHPIVMPAEWRKGPSSASIDAGLFALSGGVATSPAALTRDKWTGLGPTGKQGVMLRGQGVATSSDKATVAALVVERVTHWDGVQTQTSTAN